MFSRAHPTGTMPDQDHTAFSSACGFVTTLVQRGSRHFEDEDVHATAAGGQGTYRVNQNFSPVLGVVGYSRQEQQGMSGSLG